MASGDYTVYSPTGDSEEMLAGKERLEGMGSCLTIQNESPLRDATVRVRNLQLFFVAADTACSKQRTGDDNG